MNDNNMGWSGPISGTLAASGSAWSDPLNLAVEKPNGFFSIQAIVTGSGTLKIEYYVSNIGPETTDMIKPTGASDIVTALTAGTEFYQFPASGEPIFGKWLRLKFTETGTANPVTYRVYPNIQ
jgi:hypothetical protein